MRISTAALASAFVALFVVTQAPAYGLGAQTAAAVTASPADENPGRAVMQRACVACHVRSQVTSQHKTAQQWAETVDQMIGIGAKVSDEEYPALVAYLAKDFGPEVAPAK